MHTHTHTGLICDRDFFFCVLCVWMYMCAKCDDNHIKPLIGLQAAQLAQDRWFLLVKLSHSLTLLLKRNTVTAAGEDF